MFVFISGVSILFLLSMYLWLPLFQSVFITVIMQEILKKKTVTQFCYSRKIFFAFNIFLQAH